MGILHIADRRGSVCLCAQPHRNVSAIRVRLGWKLANARVEIYIQHPTREGEKCANQMCFVHKETKDQRPRSLLIHRFHRRCVNY